VPIELCLYAGENLIEVIGAIAAGMKAVLKPCPLRRDLKPRINEAIASEEYYTWRLCSLK